MFKVAGGFEALVTEKTREIQQIGVIDRIVGLDQPNSMPRPTMSRFLEGRLGSPGLFGKSVNLKTLKFSNDVRKLLMGFASGSLDEDASSVRLFAARGMELLIAQSYSKNMGLYAERIGAINIVCSSSDAAQR
ncbi:hypothetical protein BUALT_Bualt16G0048200 [Buddleja alternifolia]|uniref:Aminotransferase class I/classII large domain-containing protein n=1 Tax=Buddleja alternifolia TaxID=168488 RepID=A0AAV6WAP1_9LAMI|nr:hypothetical protein BUALT_Bualt16G0048200 [Buddleja alternifolia]